MAKGKSAPGWGDLAGAGVKKLFNLFGGYPPVPTGGQSQSGVWVPLGEPAGGGNVQQRGIFWGGTNFPIVVGAGAVQAILMESPRQNLAQNAAPIFQRLSLMAIDGQIDAGIAQITTAEAMPTVFDFTVGIGMYVARFNNATSLYDVQDPCSASDASRYDWVYLESRRFIYQFNGNLKGFPNANVDPKVWDLTHPSLNIDFGPGEALMLAANVVGGTVTPLTATVTIAPNLRAFLVRGS